MFKPLFFAQKNKVLLATQEAKASSSFQKEKSLGFKRKQKFGRKLPHLLSSHHHGSQKQKEIRKQRKKGRGKKPWFLPLHSDRQRTWASLGREFFVSCPNGLADGWTTRMHDEKTGRRKTSTSKFRVSRKVNKFGRRRLNRLYYASANFL